MTVVLDTDGMRYIALFESMTGAVVLDCIVDRENERLIFVVKQGEMGLAIGRGGENINRVRSMIDKKIEVVEYSSDASEFISNSFQPASIKKVKIVKKDNRNLAYVEVAQKDKGLVIGKNGRNIQKVKMLANRHHNIDDILVI
ncbi:MAG TPA: NusA-like transcription termination signal-binding factor [Candidatus Syntrophoarchaeum butanivorans]|uniref:Probable transcription termination protein NusA n=2 Tax=Candidatus Syntropharchaeum butanivorans TaxID=1839936 RepID=A0A7J2S263_9EURY|nr:NusA-like transcription termination signal-binding factor [Candidatus Syntrophoarchaeum butanivorans]